MKLIHKNVEKTGSGEITMYPEEPEDMWHLYNILQIGDQLKASTIRRVVKVGATGTTSNSREKMTLKVLVEATDFDTKAAELHIKGKTTEYHPLVRMGSYHTLDLELHRNFTLYKNEWDSFALDRVDAACNPSRNAEIGAVVLEEGLANICLITDYMTIMRQRINQTIPRKRRGDSSAYQKGLNKFYDTVFQAISTELDFDKLKVVILASPGFVAKSLFDYIMEMAVKLDLKHIFKAKQKFLILHSSTGHIHSLNEVLKNSIVESKLADTKYIQEIRMLNKFYQVMNDDDRRAWYGPKHVEKAFEFGAIGELLISDSLFRSSDIATRKKWVGLVDALRETSSTIYIFSSLHESGKQLDLLSGIAAILTYPVEEEDIEEEEEEAEE
ncbi:translation release factor eRF1 family protein [Schizosaccharomyces cryophilus OY26]|uniref:Protein DOM34 homolog n=1 Tax=Schizosaccharomyces cryophilus (strain OY26 / ATCC MYA-4695 / CBS 11777 / NBRC 106824 / NRRL Y48691) TaxID=653667 RepID=S9VPK1_SCHCR|nr:translation release factor eRF1 family protein [Schizosaccharomyces cryophilus OY26]EPY49853.1 translation release factor eRF1 family protein [Schizosaccharomyces cryophilus OY26]